MVPRRRRFSLRTLALAVAAVGVCCGALHYHVRKIRSDAALHRESIDKLRTLNAACLCVHKDFGSVFNYCAGYTARKRIAIVYAPGTSPTPEQYKAELLAVLLKLEGLQGVDFKVDVMKGDPAHDLDVDSIAQELPGVVVGVNTQ